VHSPFCGMQEASQQAAISSLNAQLAAQQQSVTALQQGVTALGPTLSGMQQRLDTITNQVCQCARLYVSS
jgi:uncharacterized coiled-coil protein SlyX